MNPSKKKIKVVGEQAEAFDYQLDHDRQLMEDTCDFMALRPEMEGEWNDVTTADAQPPTFVIISKETNEIIERDWWVCVVDIGKLVEGTTEASGFRTRFRCSEPVNPGDIVQIRRAAISLARDIVDHCIDVAEEYEMSSDGPAKRRGFKIN